jgi:hypothetical protein
MEKSSMILIGIIVGIIIAMVVMYMRGNFCCSWNKGGNNRTLLLRENYDEFQILPVYKGNMYWTGIQLKQKFRLPKNLPGNLENLPFPNSQFPAKWYGDKTTSLSFQSDQLEGIKGVAFQGLITPWDRNDNPRGEKNEIAIFYNQTDNYYGGPEFGWVFRVDQKEVLFYTLTDANKKDQVWNQWSASGNQLGQKIKNKMNDPSTERVWSIEIVENGNFLLTLTDIIGGDSANFKVERPKTFPDLSNYDGQSYVTIGAQKFQDIPLKSYPTLKVNQVKILE